MGSKVSVGDIIKTEESCERLWTRLYRKEFQGWQKPCCFYNTGLPNGPVDKVQHVEDIISIAIENPYCESENHGC